MSACYHPAHEHWDPDFLWSLLGRLNLHGYHQKSRT
jgi:hypothetical protein